LEEVSAPLVGPLAEALSRGRTEYNSRARSVPGLDGEALGSALRALDAVVQGVHAHDPAAVDVVVSALFDASVGMVVRGMTGAGARRPEADVAWRTILAAAPRMLCLEPGRVVPSIAHGCGALADVRGARLADWASTMAALAARAPDVDTWLRAGMVAAWRSGVAHAREKALAQCDSLPADLVALAVGLDVGTEPVVVARVTRRLRDDRWAWPPDVAAGIERPLGVRMTCRIGGFRGFGFGGRFLAPPLVGIRDGAFLVCDGERTFELHAYFSGASLVPVGPASSLPAPRGAMMLGAGGEVRRGDLSRVFPGLADEVSWASDDATLVASQPISHHVTIVACTGYGV
jgi:hypothetical protein